MIGVLEHDQRKALYIIMKIEIDTEWGGGGIIRKINSLTKIIITSSVNRVRLRGR